MPRGRRHRLATGVYRDGIGIAVVAEVRGRRKELRFPHGTPLAFCKNERKRLVLELDDAAPPTADGTLAATVERHLDRLPTGKHKADRRSLLQPWFAALGACLFAHITRPQLVEVLAAWEQAGLSPTTRNHRLSALRQLWRTVTTDPDRPHPCERLPRSKAPRPQANRARRMDLVALVLSHVADEGQGKVSHAKAKLTLLAYTGQPASMLAKVRPEHVRWKATPPEVYLQPRRKGNGVDAAWVPLLPDGAKAMRAWLALGAYDQPWHNGVLRVAWRKATRKAQAQLRATAKGQPKATRDRLLLDVASLEGMRVYDLRHSFLTALAVASGSLQAVAEYARHSNLQTTRTYIRGASTEVVRTGIVAMAATMPKAGNSGKVLAFR